MVCNRRPRERQVDLEILQIALRSVLLLRIESISNNENKIHKVNRHVEFPMILDLAPFWSAAASGIGSIPLNPIQMIVTFDPVMHAKGTKYRWNGQISFMVWCVEPIFDIGLVNPLISSLVPWSGYPH